MPKVKSFNEKAREIANRHESTTAYEKLMDYCDKHPEVWNNIRTEDPQFFRGLCTTAILKHQKSMRSSTFNKPKSDQFVDETHSKLVTPSDHPATETQASDVSKPDIPKIEAGLKRSEARYRSGVLEQVFEGVRLGDITHAEGVKIARVRRAKGKTYIREADWIEKLAKSLPNDDTTRIRDKYDDDFIAESHKAAQRLLVVASTRERGKTKESA